MKNPYNLTYDQAYNLMKSSAKYAECDNPNYKHMKFYFLDGFLTSEPDCKFTTIRLMTAKWRLCKDE